MIATPTWTPEQYVNALESITKLVKRTPKTALRHYILDQLNGDRAFWQNHPRLAAALKTEFERLI